jgi:hypothetical protein
MTPGTWNREVRSAQHEPRLLVTEDRVRRRTEAMFGVTLCTVATVLRPDLSPMKVRVTIRTPLMSKPQSFSPGVCLVALSALHGRMHAHQSEVRQVMVELVVTDFTPSAR